MNWLHLERRLAPTEHFGADLGLPLEPLAAATCWQKPIISRLVSNWGLTLTSSARSVMSFPSGSRPWKSCILGKTRGPGLYGWHTRTGGIYGDCLFEADGDGTHVLRCAQFQTLLGFMTTLSSSVCVCVCAGCVSELRWKERLSESASCWPTRWMTRFSRATSQWTRSWLLRWPPSWHRSVKVSGSNRHWKPNLLKHVQGSCHLSNSVSS